MNEAKKFDIRLTVEEFKGSIVSYSSRKPGMGINVTHIKHREIPAFVFPGGIRPARPTRVTIEERRAPDTSVASSVDTGTSNDVNVVDGPDDDTRKRKREDDDDLTKMTSPKRLINDGASSSGVSAGVPTFAPKGANINYPVGKLGVKAEILDQTNEDTTGQLVSGEIQKLATADPISGQYESFQSFPQQLEELEELEYSIQDKNLGRTAKENNIVSTTIEEVTSAVTISNNAKSAISGLQVNRSLEELEVCC